MGQYPDSTVLSEFFTAIAMGLLEASGYLSSFGAPFVVPFEDVPFQVVARPDADERQLRMAG